MASVPNNPDPGGDPLSPGSTPDEIIPPTPDQDNPAPIDDPSPDQGPIETPPPGEAA
ncbi:hypothetical protein [Sphingomonas gilva]|uniref:hypothetical protein n=1 Tax=Sphingomonas gilva TaxID=2305907 RepID=UPI0015F87206|nr:hypothetical protein [Sphingomonas gilva]